jgi:hypothetical protein
MPLVSANTHQKWRRGHQEERDEAGGASEKQRAAAASVFERKVEGGRIGRHYRFELFGMKFNECLTPLSLTHVLT